ncbi:hypothetical protein NP165_17410 [Vibrio japonicus]|uniref:Hydroxylamine reductase n=1 Tax=Vibrio japonicus TaxID=1824638 RepID=A0ABY5LMT8_9VIBR|nr:hypothetical protein NP165_17410 [Vibrio japonicus]
MKRIITSIVVLFISVLTLVMGLILAIPVTIFAIITGKKLLNKSKANSATFNTSSHGTVLEGEYEDVSK